MNANRALVRAVSAGAALAAFLVAGVSGAASLEPRPRLRVSDAMVRAQMLPVLVHAAQIPGIVQGPQFYPQSVASGDPRPDSVILWTGSTIRRSPPPTSRCG